MSQLSNNFLFSKHRFSVNFDCVDSLNKDCHKFQLPASSLTLQEKDGYSHICITFGIDNDFYKKIRKISTSHYVEISLYERISSVDAVDEDTAKITFRFLFETYTVVPFLELDAKDSNVALAQIILKNVALCS